MKGFLRKLGGQEVSKEEEPLIEGEGEVSNVMLQKWESIRYLSTKMHQTLSSIQEKQDEETKKEKQVLTPITLCTHQFTLHLTRFLR